MSARLKLTLSYAVLVVIAGVILLGVVAVFLLRYVPENITTDGPFAPGRSDLVRAFTPPAIASLAFLVGFGLVGGWLLAGRTLAPLERLGEAARLAADGSLSHRIRLRGANDEFREVADQFDVMLERIETHVAEQQRFAANASHELRTPLAISRTLLEVARQDPDRDADVLIAQLSDVNRRAVDLIEALLLLSRSDQRGQRDDDVDLSLLVEDVAEQLLPAAERRRLALDVSGEPAWTRGSPELLRHLVVNLVQNAIVHNTGGGAVWVRTTPSGDSSTLVVENTGALLSAERIPTLIEPFHRGSERVRSGADDHAGVGLGLAIVATIVRAHGGSLALTPRPGGGLVATATLPTGARRGSRNG